LNTSESVQIGNAAVAEETESVFLERLDELLCGAIRVCLANGDSHLAVALATAHDFVAAVLAEEHPTATRVALARTRAEIALETWRQATPDCT
jgi:hypothetical protein